MLRLARFLSRCRLRSRNTLSGTNFGRAMRFSLLVEGNVDVREKWRGSSDSSRLARLSERSRQDAIPGRPQRKDARGGRPSRHDVIVEGSRQTCRACCCALTGLPLVAPRYPPGRTGGGLRCSRGGREGVRAARYRPLKPATKALAPFLGPEHKRARRSPQHIHIYARPRRPNPLLLRTFYRRHVPTRWLGIFFCANSTVEFIILSRVVSVLAKLSH